MEVLGFRLLSSLPESSSWVAVHGHHNHWLVLLAFLVACAGSYIPLTLAERVALLQRPSIRALMMFTGGLCLAGGIWSMHFIGMLALEVPLAISFDLPTTALSLLLALLASVLAMYHLSHPNPTLGRQIGAACIIGLGITSMHYCGMASIKTQATLYYHGGLLIASLLVAISASLGAILLAQYLQRHAHHTKPWMKYLAVAVMGGAITSMHFTGMAALYFIVPEAELVTEQRQENALLISLLVATLTLLIISLGQGVAWINRRLDKNERDLHQVQTLLSKLDQAKAALESIANMDPLTELLNRRGFAQDFAHFLEYHRSRRKSLAVMFLDIDHFKRINDSLGHAVGDQLLAQAAQRLRDALREQDLIARFGGDEFCIVASLDQCDVAQAKKLANRLLDKMKEPFNLSGRQMVITLSIGISIFEADGNTADELLKNADLALYQAKDAGRNTIRFFEHGLTEQVSQQLRLEQDLHQALTHDKELEIFYQPIVDSHTGTICKLEALIRWHHPEYGFLTPDRFIGIAEANGFIQELDTWVLRRACRDMHYLEQHGFADVKIAVNCSPLNLSNQYLSEHIAEVLTLTHTSAQKLILEVTESALVSNLGRAAVKFAELRSLGLSLSLDDFGTGYSSLAYLKRLPLDTLKIDRSFVQDLEKSAQDQEVVKAIIIMAHALNLTVVAEGVETIEQMRILTEQQCDCLQGYLFSKPLPLNELLAQFPTPERAHMRIQLAR